MKKFFHVAFLSLFLMTSAQQPARAVVAASAAPVAGGMLAGGILLVLFSETAGLVPGAVFGALGAVGGSEGAKVGFSLGWILGTIAAFAGGIVMINDAKGVPVGLKFAELTAKQAKLRGMTLAEKDIFNDSVPLLNVSREDISHSKALKAKRNLSFGDVANEWDLHLKNVESETGLTKEILKKVFAKV